MRLRTIRHGFQLVGGSGDLAFGHLACPGWADSSAKVASASVSVTASMVSRSSSEEGSSTASPAPSGPVILLVRGLSWSSGACSSELATVSVEEVVNARNCKELSVLEGLMEEDLGASLPMN